MSVTPRRCALLEPGAIAHQKQLVTDDVLRIRDHPWVPQSLPIYGYIYDVKTGNLIEVDEATNASAAG